MNIQLLGVEEAPMKPPKIRTQFAWHGCFEAFCTLCWSKYYQSGLYYGFSRNFNFFLIFEIGFVVIAFMYSAVTPLILVGAISGMILGCVL